jgi:hypothetical protein
VVQPLAITLNAYMSRLALGDKRRLQLRALLRTNGGQVHTPAEWDALMAENSGRPLHDKPLRMTARS